MIEQQDAFRSEVIERSKNELGPLNIIAGFVSVAGQLLEEAEELVDFVSCPFRGTGAHRKNLGVDGYAFDEVDSSLRIVITDFSGASLPEKITQTNAKATFAKVTAFIEEVLAGDRTCIPSAEDPVNGFAEILRLYQTSITRYRIYLATDCMMSERIRTWPDEIIQNIEAEFHIWDIDRFFNAANSRSGRDVLTIDFTAFVDGGLPCLPASLNLSDYSGYLCVLPGLVLAQIYEKYGSRLLEGNVRAFLGKERAVNKGMRNTIQSSPEMFFAFNNGIAVTAKSITCESSESGMRILSADDLQIVNGGQTTASLTFAKRKDGADLSKVFVQMKLSVVDDDHSGELISNISRFANSQTKVADSDLFSNHEFHRKMEELSRRILAPAIRGSQRQTSWFYERARGQYRIETSAMSPSEKTRFESESPRKQLITKTDLAKIENAWRRLPHEVCKGAEKSFGLFSKYIVSEWDRDSLQFNDEYFRTVVAHAIVFRELEALIPQEPWYDGAYRSQVVAYSIAKLELLIAEQATDKVLNTQLVWKNQVMSSALRAQLQLIASAVYAELTSPDQGFENVSEWSKKELAWQRISARKIELNHDFDAELISSNENADRKDAATTNAKIDIGIVAISEVLAFKHSNWKILREWGLGRKEFTPKEDLLLILASTFGKIPNDRQAAAMLLIRDRCIEGGFSLN